MNDVALKAGNKIEIDYISSQKQLDAINLLSQNGDINDPIYLREELRKILKLLANESIDKERAE